MPTISKNRSPTVSNQQSHDPVREGALRRQPSMPTVLQILSMFLSLNRILATLREVADRHTRQSK